MRKTICAAIGLIVFLGFTSLEQPTQEDTDTHTFRSDFERHSVKWWLPPGLSNSHPQVAFHFIDVPAPDPNKSLKEIRLSMEEYLSYWLGAVNFHPTVFLTVATLNPTEWLTLNIRGVPNARLVHDQVFLQPQSLVIPPRESEYADEEVSFRTVTGSITSPKVLDLVEDLDSPKIMLKIRSDSQFDIIFNHPWFIYLFFIESGIYGEITYVYT